MNKLDKILKWSEISKETIFEKHNRRINKIVYKLPNGNISDFYIKDEGIAVSVLALTEDNTVILVEEFRPGPNEVLFEMPGGFMGKSEKPEDVASRELLEETGYKGNVFFVAKTLDDAYSTMDRYCFVVTNCKKVSDQKLDNEEFARVKLVSVDKFREILRSGRMTDVEVGYLCLDFLNLL